MKPSMGFSLILTILLAITSALYVPFVDQAKAAPNLGVFIDSDGTIHGTDSMVRSGDLYTLTGDVVGPLIVRRDNIVIDGAGYTVTGASGRGMILSDRNAVTIKDTIITLAGGYAIDLTNATDCMIVGNTLIGSLSPIPAVIAISFLHSQRITVKDNMIENCIQGLALEWSSGHVITDNTITDSFVGITITNTSECTFRNNLVSNCKFGFGIQMFPGYLFDNDLDTSNTVDGKPIYYWVNVKDKTVPPEAVYIVLVKCQNILIEKGNPQAINLASTINSTIRNVEMTGNGSGITLLQCTNMNIINNILRDRAIGIVVDSSYNNRIVGNEISNEQTRGIALANATDNLIQANTFINNSYAIGPFGDSQSNGNTIASNNFTANTYAITVTGISNIIGNYFEKNQNAIMFSSTTGTTVSQNTFINTKYVLYFTSASGNKIFLNNFLHNDHQVTDAGATNSSTMTLKNHSIARGSLQLTSVGMDAINFFPPPPPSTNQYDNGEKGNYWIDYKGTDTNGDGIGDSPYVLYENNQDNYPLMNQVSIPSTITLPTEAPSPTTSEPTNNTININPQEVIYIAAGVVAIVMLSLLISLYWRKKNQSKIYQVS